MHHLIAADDANIFAAIVGNVWNVPGLFLPRIASCTRHGLRIAIVLLGLQVPLSDMIDLGWQSLLVVVSVCLGTFYLTKAAARLMGVDHKLGELLAGGTAICGASAILAINTSTQASEEDVAYSLACVTLFGSISMLVIPLLAQIWGLDRILFSVWAGASIHEIGQVAGAALQFGQESGEIAMVAKLARVLMLGPIVMLIGLGGTRARQDGMRDGHKIQLVPGFVIGFFVSVALGNLIDLPSIALETSSMLTAILLALALAGLGFSIRLQRLIERGWAPLAVASFSTITISALSLALLFLAAPAQPV